MSLIEIPVAPTHTAVARLRTFCFPGGEEAARLIRSVRTTEKGQMRMSPGARWMPFTAEQTIDATRSNFRWEARLDPGKIAAPTVTDAYEDGHGRLSVKLAGIVPLKQIRGLEMDTGELQRYLASVIFCPPMMLNNLGLEWTEISPSALRVRDARSVTSASIEINIADDGRPLSCGAVRPRLFGSKSILTPWFAACGGFHEWEGLRVPRRTEVLWHLPEGEFSYFRSEITSFVAIR